MRKEVLLLVLLMGCVGASELDGSWRIYSEKLYYDAGGSSPTVMYPVTRKFELSGSRWEFGDSAGSFVVEPIEDSDWERWGIEPYGPTRKIVLEGWNDGIADGPLDESTRVDFIWVIYRVEPPLVEWPGAVWLKFGR